MSESTNANSGLKTWIKKNFERFCNVSTMHGYTELYSAKTRLFQIIWTVIIMFSIAITAYQVNEAVYEYVYQSSFTNIAPATEKDVIYPPLKICLPHWIMWVNFTKAGEFFSKNATLFSLLYLTDIYTLEQYNIQEARQEFLAGFAKYNFSDLFDYYAQIALPPSTWIFFAPNNQDRSIIQNEFQKYISEIFYIDWFNTQSEHPVLCYTMNGSSIKAHFEGGYKQLKSDENTKTNLHLYLDPSVNDLYAYNIWSFEESLLIEKYIEIWQAQTGYNKSSSVPIMPYLLLIDGYTADYFSMALSEDIVTFKVKANANVWITSAAKPCREGKFVTSNKTCQQMCASKYYVEDPREITYDVNHLDNCSMLLQSFYGQNNKEDLPKLCRNMWLFFEQDHWDTNDYAPDVSDGLTNERLIYTESRKKLSGQFLPQCLSTCSISYCENWKFEISKAVRSKSDRLLPNIITGNDATFAFVEVMIEYPEVEQILIFTETDRQTWENFVSNVGGLLGIWTGASILSFIQLFYLCCCAAIDEAYTPKRFRLGIFSGGISQQNTVKWPNTNTIQRRTRSNSK